MKKLFPIVILLFCAGTLFAQQKPPDLKVQLQLAKLEAHNNRVLYKAADAKADSLIIYVSDIVREWRKLDNGIKMSTLILQKAITNNEKPNYKELIDAGWNLVLPDSAAAKSDNKNKPQK